MQTLHSCHLLFNALAHIRPEMQVSISITLIPADAREAVADSKRSKKPSLSLLSLAPRDLTRQSGFMPLQPKLVNATENK